MNYNYIEIKVSKKYLKTWKQTVKAISAPLKIEVINKESSFTSYRVYLQNMQEAYTIGIIRGKFGGW